MPFARALAAMCEELKATGRGQPGLPSKVPKALDTFKSMDYGRQPELWQYVNLGPVFTYLRGAKGLQIPEDWAPVIPKAFPGDS